MPDPIVENPNPAPAPINPDPQPTDWKANLDPAIKDHPCLANFNNSEDVVKSYVGVQPIIGREKIPLPPENATKEDWDMVFDRLGRPSTIDGYKIAPAKMPEGFPAQSEEKLKGFKAKALELGLLPAQADSLYQWYMGDVSAEYNNHMEGLAVKKGDAEAGLRKEWGKGYDAKIASARQVVNEFGDPEFGELIDSGLGNDPRFLKFLAKLGGKISEDGITTGQPEVTLTPEEAMGEIRKIQGDPKHPYFDKMHPEHELSVRRMKDLYELAYPSQSAPR